jgi:hypothetical protein
VFDGIASHTPDNYREWVTEFHTDGHIIAGIWGFPESGEVKFVTDNYIDAFLDFGNLVSNLFNAAEINGGCFITCSMINAAELTFSLSGRPNPVSRVRRQHLQWRVRNCQESSQIGEISSLMAADFMRVYGHFRQIKAKPVS